MPGVAALRCHGFGRIRPHQGINMRTHALTIALGIAALLAAGLTSGPASAQKGAKNSCPGGISACIERCSKMGGQPRLCPTYCQKQKGC